MKNCRSLRFLLMTMQPMFASSKPNISGITTNGPTTVQHVFGHTAASTSSSNSSKLGRHHEDCQESSMKCSCLKPPATILLALLLQLGAQFRHQCFPSAYSKDTASNTAKSKNQLLPLRLTSVVELSSTFHFHLALGPSSKPAVSTPAHLAVAVDVFAISARSCRAIMSPPPTSSLAHRCSLPISQRILSTWRALHSGGFLVEILFTGSGISDSLSTVAVKSVSSAVH